MNKQLEQDDTKNDQAFPLLNSKRQCKKLYKSGEIFLNEALIYLMNDHFMHRCEAINYLEK